MLTIGCMNEARVMRRDLGDVHEVFRNRGHTAILLASSVARAQELKLKEDMRVVAPALEKYAQDRILGEVWKRPDLSARDSVVTLAALIARSQTIELLFYLDLALDARRAKTNFTSVSVCREQA